MNTVRAAVSWACIAWKLNDEPPVLTPDILWCTLGAPESERRMGWIERRQGLIRRANP